MKNINIKNEKQLLNFLNELPKETKQQFLNNIQNIYKTYRKYKLTPKIYWDFFSEYLTVTYSTVNYKIHLTSKIFIQYKKHIRDTHDVKVFSYENSFKNIFNSDSEFTLESIEYILCSKIRKPKINTKQFFAVDNLLSSDSIYQLQKIERNKNEFGGGIAFNITKKVTSNRCAQAHILKYTFGDICKYYKLKRNGGYNFKVKEIVEWFSFAVTRPEWHHAGWFKNQAGKTCMKKVYFLNSIPTANEILLWKYRYEKHIKNKNEKIDYLKNHAIYFERSTDLKKYSIVTNQEMKGCYGFFKANFKYRTQVYYTGYTFENKKEYVKFINKFK